ncbi:McrB family protein [Teredinibacter purpureus]|uniref:McrB family protein n=1 Tax=Teredinibacter purpureus TaxID=2731756 RepID=UPI0009E558C2|nr:AAA family ATPase [Teredinibacter purpureus]
MINESISNSESDLKKFVSSLVETKKISIEQDKLNDVIEQLTNIVTETKKYTDWNVKSNTTAELKLRLRSVLDKHQLPISDEVLSEILAKADTTTAPPKSYWFVGASYGKGSEDQTDRFLAEGVWQNGYKDKYLDVVRSMQPGDKIAIKSSYVRKRNLSFDNKEQSVSVMGIKAIGVVTKNHGDGRFVDVDWEPRQEPVKEWYFYTNRSTIWRVSPDEWMTEGLVNFTFNSKPQDVDRFRNAPYWKERFGDTPIDKQRFKWTQFYEAVADKLITYKDKRQELISFVIQLADKFDLSYIKDKQLDDICPFTVIGLFNRGITDENRKAIAKDLADYLGVTEGVPNSFEGIPILNNQKSWFFGFEDKRQTTDIESLWSFFDIALQFSDSDNSDARSEFSSAYDQVTSQYGVGWNLTMALYWIRPWNYLTLDGQSQLYITKKLGIDIGKNGPKRRCSSKDYLKVLDELELRFQEEAYPVHSFPELSLAAWLYKDGDTSAHPNATDPDFVDETADDEGESEVTAAPIEPYQLDDIITDGCFIDRESLGEILERLRTKKNLILQGPPGTGKTWLAKRLAFALMGQRNDSKLRAVQFHPNLSYEDFVRGWRPSGDGKLTLADGPFLEMINEAKKDAKTKHVVVIEEINRGNPAQIFGEMLTLLEADKRTPTEALELSYRRNESERVFVPDNLYVIGTMNVADRSLALVDLALRRRFAFIDLKPIFGEPWRQWVHAKAGISMTLLEEIETRLLALNNDIEKDRNLGAQFKVGHSYVTPAFSNTIKDAEKWYKSVVQTEIGPLLDEYWFDDLERSRKAQDALVVGI